MTGLSRGILIALLAGAAAVGGLTVDAPHTAYSADVCAGVGGRHVSVNTCGNPIERWATPPSDYAPMPEDFAAPPRPRPNINVCAGVGRRVRIGGCI